MWVHACLELLIHLPQPPRTGITGALQPTTPTSAMLSAYSSYFITNSSYMGKHSPTTNQGIIEAATHQVHHKNRISLRCSLVLTFLGWKLWDRFLCVVQKL